MSTRNDADIEKLGCPACGADVERDAFICPSCDFILDSSFLEEEAAAVEDEDTDPRMSTAPDLSEEESTDPRLQGVDARLVAVAENAEESEITDMPDDDCPTMAGSLDDDDDDHPTLAGSLEDEYEPEEGAAAGGSRGSGSAASAARAPARAGSQPLPVPEPDYSHSVTAARHAPEPSARRRRSENTGDSAPFKEVVTDTSLRKAPARRSGSTASSDSAKASSAEPSVLLDEYEKVFKEVWQQFSSISAADKVLSCGLVLALFSILLPWRTLVFENGLSSVRAGIATGGWLNLIFVVGCGAILYYRNWKGMSRRIELIAAQVGLAVAGLGWSFIAFLVGWRIAATAPYFGEAKAGPEYGVIISILAWAVVCAGALLTLLDGMIDRRRNGRS